MNAHGKPSTRSNRDTSVTTRCDNLGLMTKYWESGKVKTRLGKSIGMGAAASLHQQFVLHLCRCLGGYVGRRTICLSPETRLSTAREELEKVGLAKLWQIAPQAEGDLGARMQHWFRSVLSSAEPRKGRSTAILIGSDCPTLSLLEITRAAAELESNDVVIGPAYDGGYYLIGIASPWNDERFRCLFESVPWSSDRVLTITRQRLQQSDLSWAELKPRHDVDTEEDLDRLRESLAGREQIGSGTAELAAAMENVLRQSSSQLPNGAEHLP